VAVVEGVLDSEPVGVLLSELVPEGLAVCMHAKPHGADAARPVAVHGQRANKIHTQLGRAKRARTRCSSDLCRCGRC